MKKASKAGEKQAKKRRNPNIVQAGKATQFQKNNPITGEKDPRINRNGAPRVFSELRDLAKELLNATYDVKDREGRVIDKTTQVKSMLQLWMLSQDFNKQNRLLEIAHGKVPDELNVNSEIFEFIIQNIDLFTDGQLKRLNQGENPMSILGELLREVKPKDKK